MSTSIEQQVVVARATIVFGGLFGAIGVMAAAGASHGESRNLMAIAAIGLSHGPALLAIGLAGRGRVLAIAALLLGLGTAVFLGDLGLREWMGRALFPGAAPLGGAGMIAGWVTVGVAGLFHPR